MDARHELKEAVEQAIANLKAVADRHPDTPAKADVFNMLLGRVKQISPDSEIVKGLDPVDGGTTAADLVFRLSVMAGAIKSDFAVCGAGGSRRQIQRGASATIAEAQRLARPIVAGDQREDLCSTGGMKSKRSLCR